MAKTETDKPAATAKKKQSRTSPGGPRFRRELLREDESLKFAGSPRINGGYTLNVRRIKRGTTGEETVISKAKEESFSDYNEMLERAEPLVAEAIAKGWEQVGGNVTVNAEEMFD